MSKFCGFISSICTISWHLLIPFFMFTAPWLLWQVYFYAKCKNTNSFLMHWEMLLEKSVLFHSFVPMNLTKIKPSTGLKAWEKTRKTEKWRNRGGVRGRWFPAKHWAKASETKQNFLSRHGLHINTAAHSTGILITVARRTFSLRNIWAVCLSYAELDMHCLKSCVVYLCGNVCTSIVCMCVWEYVHTPPVTSSKCIYDDVWQGGISAQAEEDDDECLLRCWNTNQAGGRESIQGRDTSVSCCGSRRV